MTDYVLGFLFSLDYSHVLLMQKKRPTWQAGKLNGIGGHIEDGESPMSAMIREFEEETGERHESWRVFCTMSGEDWSVECFMGFHPDLSRCTRSKHDEVSLVVPTANLPPHCIPNLRWLIPLALDGSTAIVKESP